MAEINYSPNPAGNFSILDPCDTEFMDNINDCVTGPGSGVGGQSGAGSPEGSVTAEPGVVYWDTAGQALWAKNTGTGNTGWVLVVTL